VKLLAWVPLARVDKLSNHPMEMIVKEDGGFSISFDGASAAGANAFNCDKGAMEGGQWVLLTQILIYGDKVNDGAYYAVEKYYPLGSWANPGDPYLSYQSIQGGGIYSAGPLKGERWMLSTFEISGQGLGASAVKDGLNWGYAMWNPEADPRRYSLFIPKSETEYSGSR